MSTKKPRTYKGPRYWWTCEDCDTDKTLSYRPGCFVVSYCKTCKRRTEHAGVMEVDRQGEQGA